MNKSAKAKPVVDLPRQTSLTLPEAKPQLERIAYSLGEFAQMLGISYISAYRLYQRGKIRRCGHLSKILISRDEIARFLKEAA